MLRELYHISYQTLSKKYLALARQTGTVKNAIKLNVKNTSSEIKKSNQIETTNQDEAQSRFLKKFSLW